MKCPVPFYQLYINNGGYVNPCCHVYPQYADSEGRESLESRNVLRHGVKKAFDSSYMQELRQQLRDDQWPSKCLTCKKEEDIGVLSPRQVAVQSCGIDFVEPKITHLDLRLGNVCNLKCRMCSPFSSVALQAEWLESPDEKMRQHANWLNHLEFSNWSEDPKIWQEIDELASSVTHINFAGGEPFLNKMHTEFLLNPNTKMKPSQIELSYNTNLSVLPIWFESVIQRFQKVILFVSIDGYGELNEYIRYPLKWSTLMKNLVGLNELAKKYSNLTIKIQTTVQAYNVLEIDKLFEFLIQNELDALPRVPVVFFVHNPDFLRVGVLPHSTRQEASRRLNDLLDRCEKEFLLSSQWKKKLHHVIQNIQNTLQEDLSSTHFEKFKQMTKFFDQQRKQKSLYLIDSSF